MSHAVNLLPLLKDVERAIARMRRLIRTRAHVDVLDSEAARLQHAAEAVGRGANVNWQAWADKGDRATGGTR